MLFEIAAVSALSIDAGYDAVFNPCISGIVHREISEYTDNIFRNVAFSTEPKAFHVYNEPKFSYSPLPVADGMLYDGHFQSEKYFLHRRSDILRMFEPSSEFIEKVKLEHPYISKSCGIHVRRGDYLKYPDIHPVQQMDYYNKAIDFITEHGCNSFVIFSDDIEWCKQNFIGEKFTFLQGNKDWEDLWLMSLCKHIIMSNSSFSWWGSWLGTNEDRRTVSPRNWFGSNGPIDTSDVYAKRWEII